jgi:ribosomal protein L37AE/L43A
MTHSRSRHRCPKCAGNLMLEREREGLVATCLQCSRSFAARLQEPVPAKQITSALAA